MFESYKETRNKLETGELTVLETVNYFIRRIKENSSLNAFLEVFENEAIEQAKQIDKNISKGLWNKLSGLVVGLKDNICYKNHKVSNSSKILEGFESLYSATVVERLIDEGAIVIGRLNCDEFAMGSSNENSAFGAVKNNWDQRRVSGGSSGGSAVAVSANLCHIALGSDTGGSIRQPASFTGTVGLKPTYGRVSRHGLLAYASSFDQIGTFSNNVEDNALVLEVISGSDDFDATASKREVEHFSKSKLRKEKYKIAVFSESLNAEGLNVEVKKNFNYLIEKIKKIGHEVEEVSFPYMEYMVPTYYVLTTAEASSNLSRYDGIHYGYQSKNAKGIEEVYKNSRSEGFGKEVKRRIMAGTFVLSNEYYEAYYTKAQKVRRVIKDKTTEILNYADFILTPTTPDVAFKINGITDPISMYLQDIFTVHANLSGNPAISIPFGKNSNNLPFGVQFMAKHFEESELFSFSTEIESFNL